MKSFAIPSVYEALNLVMKYYPDNFNEKARVEIETLFAHCLEGLSDDSEKFLSSLFIKSLKNHISFTSINENIYLKKYEVSQIELFDMLIKKFPFVTISQQIVNGAILNEMQDCSEVTIIDIGIGQGTQMANLIELATDLPVLKKLHVVGIEPSADALANAENNLKLLGESAPFTIHFYGVNAFAENFDFKIPAPEGDKIIVNASLALHHIQTSENRFATLQKIKNLKPDAFFLIEPNVDHFEPNFYRRFQNCYQHFYSIFQVIDKLDLKPDYKNAFKLFYGREIEDIIGKQDSSRFEKHEPAFRWIEKLNQAGFKLNTNYFDFPVETPIGLKIAMHPEGFLGFTYGTETVLAIMYAK
ncbi:MAG: GRAS family protein [Salinivirgaceae bacterium]